jgi:hypothetical protein
MDLIGMVLVFNDIGYEYKECDHDDGYVGSSMHDINMRKFKWNEDEIWYIEWECESYLSLETFLYHQGMRTLYPCQISVHSEIVWKNFNIGPIHRSLFPMSSPSTMYFRCFFWNSFEMHVPAYSTTRACHHIDKKVLDKLHKLHQLCHVFVYGFHLSTFFLHK